MFQSGYAEIGRLHIGKNSIGNVMKKYVIIASCIKDMGGQQMYFRNKCVSMQSLGWNVDLISAQKGKIYIQDLKQYDCFVPELGFDYFLYSKSKRNKIVRDLICRIVDRDYDEIVIESSCIPESTWAEAIAERCKAKHLCFILQEKNVITSENEQDFLMFKQSRRELAGITDSSIYDMFETFRPIKKEESLKLSAYCNNVVEDVASEFMHTNVPCDYTIGLLSRLDKPFIMPAVNDIIEYATLHANKRFLLIMMGGAPSGSNYKSKILKRISTVRNIEVVVTGFIFPVPQGLLEMCDVHISSAGSSWVCCKSGVPTISYDGKDFRPIGILERTTVHSLFRGETEKPVNLNVLLDDILLKKKYEIRPTSFDSIKMDFSKHIEFMSLTDPTKEYYDFERLSLSFEEKKLSYFLMLLGPRIYTWLGFWKRNLINSFT